MTRTISNRYRQQVIDAVQVAVQKLNLSLWQVASVDIPCEIKVVNGQVVITFPENNNANQS